MWADIFTTDFDFDFDWAIWWADQVLIMFHPTKDPRSWLCFTRPKIPGADYVSPDRRSRGASVFSNLPRHGKNHRRAASCGRVYLLGSVDIFMLINSNTIICNLVSSDNSFFSMKMQRAFQNNYIKITFQRILTLCIFSEDELWLFWQDS